MIGIQFRYFKNLILFQQQRRNQVLDFEKLLSFNSGKCFLEISESGSYNHGQMPFFREYLNYFL